jgi:hypothetical protein
MGMAINAACQLNLFACHFGRTFVSPGLGHSYAALICEVSNLAKLVCAGSMNFSMQKQELISKGLFIIICMILTSYFSIRHDQ